MRILFATSEYAGLFKLGGLADVSAALPAALAALGMDVTVIIPRYSQISVRTKRMGSLAVPWSGKTHEIELFTTEQKGVRLVFASHPMLDEYYSKHIEGTFAWFSTVIAAFVTWSALAGQKYDIVHCNDWHTALVPLLLGEERKRANHSLPLQAQSTKTVLTIHNLLYQGTTTGAVAHTLVVSSDRFHYQGKSNHVNMLREGLEYADAITTVSPTYAKELLKPAFSEGLRDLLVARKDHLFGILNGIDTDMWNPGRDSAIISRYSPQTYKEGKAKNKAELQKYVGLPVRHDTPVLSFIGRLEVQQKGIELLLAAVKSLLSRTSLQLVILGKGEGAIVKELTEFARKHPAHVSCTLAFDDKLAHMIYAGSDMIAVPSRFEPCGLVQMIAMRYGTVPIVRKTGGLADTVREGRTGFMFVRYDASALTAALIRALTVYEKRPDQWGKLVREGMGKDFSWEKSAKLYKILYEELGKG